MRETVLKNLRNILLALEHSEPKAKQYPEPLERHQQAIKECQESIDILESINEDQFYTNEKL